MQYSIDLNSDMGESFGAYKIGNDEGIIQYITSTNVACGYHAGDPMVMDRVVKMAKERGVAVGNLCQYDRETSRAICEAVYEIDPTIRIFYCAGAVLGEEAEKLGLATAAEIFADRAYMEDLSLVPRKHPGSMITDEDLAVERCIRMIKEGMVTTITGKDVPIKGDTLCVHGDGAKALAFVERIRAAFQAEGIAIRNFL